MKLPIDDIEIGPRFRKDMGDLEGLAASIEREGLLQPIGINLAKELVFGHRRLNACRLLGWTDIFVVVVDVTSIIAGEYEENEVRKDFSVSERVAIMETIEKRSLGDNQHTAGSQDIATLDEAAKLSGFGNRETARQAKSVRDHGSEELVAAMDSGVASIYAANDIATLPEDEQQEIVARGEKEILKAAKNIRARKAEASRKERITRIAEISKGNTNLETDRQYPIIYADPPWCYEHPGMGVTNNTPEHHYPTMSLEEICALPVGDLATNDANLYLWATSPILSDCMKVIEAWGFEYRTSFVWVKDRFGLGYHARNQHELLLVAKRGKVPPPPPEARQSSVIHATRTEHSVKPQEFYTLIEGMYPELPKIELFCRSPRDGWEAWGNQVEEEV